MSFIGKILLTQLVELVIGIPVAMIFWPLLLYFWSIVKIVRLCVEFFLNSSLMEKDDKDNGDKNGSSSSSVQYRLAQGSDSVFGYKAKNNCNSIIPGYCIVEGKFDLELIRKRIGRMVEGNPKLRQIFTKKLGFFCWKRDDESFDLGNHVRVIMPPDQVADEEKVMDILERLAMVPINNQYPMWELLLIPSFRLPGEAPDSPTTHFAEILRVDHSYGDGVSFCLTSNAFLFDEPAQLPLDPKQPFPVPAWVLMLQYIKVILLGPFYLTRHVFVMTRDRSKFSVQGDYAPTKYLGRSKVPIKLSMLKEIKAKSNVSLTAILLSSLTSSLRNAHRRLFPLDDIPSVINTGNVNAMLPYPDDLIQNRFTIFPFTAPFSSDDHETETDRKRLLMKTNEAGYRVTLSPDPIFCYFMLKVVGDLPCALQNSMLSISGTPLMLSNIPGIVGTVKVFGGKVIDSGAWLPLIRVTGVAVATYTYRGEVRFCGIADPNVFPQRSDLQQFLDDAVNEVHQLARLYQDQVSEEEEMKEPNIQKVGRQSTLMTPSQNFVNRPSDSIDSCRRRKDLHAQHA